MYGKIGRAESGKALIGHVAPYGYDYDRISGPFTMTAQSKGTLIDDLALAIEDRAITLLNDPVLMGELRAHEMDRLPSGIFTYNAPSGGHDDTVIALALAWQAAGMSRIARVRVYA